MATLPTSNLHVMDVRNILCYPSTDVGTLCGGNSECAAKINKWSKYKPVINAFTHDRPDDWWKGTSNTCGLSVPQYETLGAMLDAIDAGDEMWAYNPPTGGSTAPFRLGDFCGYNHSAYAPIRTTSLSTVQYTSSHTISIEFLKYEFSDDVGNLDLDDIGDYGDVLGDYYPAIVTRVSGASSAKLITASDTIGSSGSGTVTIGSSSTTLSSNGFTAGVTYDFIYCLSSLKQTTYGGVGTDDDNTFVPIPGEYMQTITFYTTGITWTVIVYYYETSLKITYSITATNEGDESCSLSGVTLYLVYPDNSVAGGSRTAMRDDEFTLSLSSATVGASGESNDEASWTGSITTGVDQILPEIDDLGGMAVVYYTASLFDGSKKTEPVSILMNSN